MRLENRIAIVTGAAKGMGSAITRTLGREGADLLLAGDLGCLMNIAGRLKREGSSVEVRHVAEVLAGMSDQTPPIGEVDEG